MKASRFSEEQIIAILKEQEAGVRTAEVCRRHGVSSATFYKWKAKFGGLEVSEAKRLRQLEDENAKLKRVRRQNIWHRSRRKLAECGPRLLLGFRRRAYGVASADVQWSVA